MATASLNIPIEIPNSANLNLEELKRQLTDYARMLINQAANGALHKKEIHPHVQALCGVISYPEDDLDGEKVRSEYLTSKHPGSDAGLCTEVVGEILQCIPEEG